MRAPSAGIRLYKSDCLRLLELGRERRTHIGDISRGITRVNNSEGEQQMDVVLFLCLWRSLWNSREVYPRIAWDGVRRPLLRWRNYKSFPRGLGGPSVTLGTSQGIQVIIQLHLYDTFSGHRRGKFAKSTWLLTTHFTKRALRDCLIMLQKNSFTCIRPK